MKTLQIMMIMASLFCFNSLIFASPLSENSSDLLRGNNNPILLAQNDEPPPEFFDNEINQQEEIIPDEMGVQNDPPPEDAPSRFRTRQSRFNRDGNTSDSGNTPVQINKPTTPVKEIQVQKVSEGKKKISFADAQPEDITDENFPDIIESFDYPNANITDVASAISKLTKKNFIMEPGVSGKITIVAPTPVTVAQAWKLFLTALAMNNYTIVPTGDGYLKIRKETNAKNDSIETYSGGYYPTSDLLITRIIQLKYIQAESVKKSLEKFVSKKAGDVESYENTNSIIISGYGSSVERISRIIEELDKPGFEERLEVLPIRHAKSKDIAELIEKIIKDGEADQKDSRFSRSRFSKGDEGKTENLKLVAPDERTNSIIVVGNKDGIERIKKLVERLDYPLDPADAGGVYVYYVKHGEAVKIAETLSGIAQETEKAAQKSTTDSKSDKTFQAPKVQQPIFGGNVVLKADENTNSLIITASKQDYKVVKNLLAKIDIPKDQVFVEAVIMEMGASNTDLWNMNYMKFFKSDTATNTGQGEGIARAGFSGGNLGSLLNPTSGKGAILNIGDPNSEKIQINTGNGLIEIPSLIALISFLKEKTNANILSTPNIIAMDNEESMIEVGEDVPVGGTQTVTAGISTITPEFKKATIMLKIKPFISPDSDIVRLNVEQKISKVSNKITKATALANTTQALSTKEVKTNVVMESGQTVVLGGLMEDQDSVTESKVPLLGDIPVLGWLFKNRTVETVKNNLVVFLTPKIIRNSFGHKNILKDKLGERIDWIKKNAGGKDPYGERFNNLIQDSSQTSKTYVPNNEEIELDLEEATPLGPESEIE